MTAPDTTCGEPTAAHRAMLLQRFDRVRRTRWIIATCRGQIGGESYLIHPHAPHQELSHQPRSPKASPVAVLPASAVGHASAGMSPARSKARLHCTRKSPKLARYADGNARTTTSTAGTRASFGSMSCRTISRRRRFTRLRSTELCEYFGTMTPARACGSADERSGECSCDRSCECSCECSCDPARDAERRREAMNRTSRCAVRTRFPFKRTVSSSPSRVSRTARGKRLRSDAGVLRRQLNGQALAPLLTTAAQHLSAPSVGHTRTEPVRPDATFVARTVSRLAHVYSKMLVKSFMYRLLNLAGS